MLALWERRPDVPVTQSLVRLLADEAVPCLAAYRYEDSGLRKREAWEETWRLQRLEDAGEKTDPTPLLQPWVDQWHAEVDPTYGVSLAAFCQEQLTARAAQVGKTLRNWPRGGPSRRPAAAGLEGPRETRLAL